MISVHTQTTIDNCMQRLPARNLYRHDMELLREEIKSLRQKNEDLTEEVDCLRARVHAYSVILDKKQTTINELLKDLVTNQRIQRSDLNSKIDKAKKQYEQFKMPYAL